MLIVAFRRFCSKAAYGMKVPENLFLFCSVLPHIALLLIQSWLEFDSLCNQLIDGTSTGEGQEYEAWSPKGPYQCRTLISLNSELYREWNKGSISRRAIFCLPQELRGPVPPNKEVLKSMFFKEEKLTLGAVLSSRCLKTWKTEISWCHRYAAYFLTVSFGFSSILVIC